MAGKERTYVCIELQSATETEENVPLRVIENGTNSVNYNINFKSIFLSINTIINYRNQLKNANIKIHASPIK